MGKMEQESQRFKIIAGQSKPSTGNISAPKEAVVAYLPQHLLLMELLLWRKLLRHLVKFFE
jgi:ATPase subunit of ABC transporter with duplicated ATPase domains